MALSADVKRTYGVPGINSVPVKATSQIYEGSAVGMTSGYARALVAGDIFVGFSLENVLGGATDGAKYVAVQGSGLVQLAISALAVTDIGLDVYASADGTFTLTQSTNSPIGRVHRWVSTGVGIIAFNADHPMKLTGLTLITDSTGGSTTGNTVDDATASVKDDIAQLAKHINIIYNALK